LLTQAQVLQIALSEAKSNGELHPSRIMTASGRLKKALKVFDPQSGITPYGIALFGGANTPVDLVALYGHFTHYGAKLPPFTRRPRGRVIELIVNAHTGDVLAFALLNKLRAPLSRLGRVSRLR
jgi:hypothetical protein